MSDSIDLGWMTKNADALEEHLAGHDGECPPVCYYADAVIDDSRRLRAEVELLRADNAAKSRLIADLRADALRLDTDLEEVVQESGDWLRERDALIARIAEYHAQRHEAHARIRAVEAAISKMYAVKPGEKQSEFTRGAIYAFDRASEFVRAALAGPGA